LKIEDEVGDAMHPIVAASGRKGNGPWCCSRNDLGVWMVLCVPLYA